MKDERRRFLVALFVMAMLVFVPRCGNRARAEHSTPVQVAEASAKGTAPGGENKLDRDTALKILKEHESRLLPTNQYERLEFLMEPYSLPMLTASDGEMAGTEPFVLPTLDEYERVAVAASSLDAQLKEGVVHQFASGLFFSALSNAQVVQLTELKNKQVYLGAMGLAPPIVPATEVHYDRASAPGVEVIWGQHDGYHRNASVQPITWRFTAVTGITGEGISRAVEAAAQASATPSLIRLQEIARTVLRQQHREEAAYLSGCGGRTSDYLCVILGYKVPPPRTDTIVFQRYDDGWRIVRLPGGPA